MLALVLLEIQPARTWAFPLPYDNTCPVIYDNDDADDMYTDEYLLSLASAGGITLKGMITTSGGWSQPTFPDPVFNYQWDLSGRTEIVGKALRSGLTNLPTPVAGSGVALVQPGSGILEDTTPIDTPGAHLIVTEAHNATTNQPLVVVMGGPPTTLASAYLMDNSITNTVVLTWLSGGPGENDVQNFNDTADQWATTIVDQRFRVVLFGPVFQSAALVDKSLLTNLPNTELRRWMIDKNLPHVNLPDGQDHDGPPAITLMRPDYILTAKPKSVGGINGNGTLFLQDDPNGNILMVTTASQAIATAEWWRALSNSAAYGNNPLSPTLTPYTNGSPAAIPGRVEAERFDYGGPDVSYSNLTVKTEDEYLTRYPTTFRVTDSVDFDLVTNTSGFAIAVTQAGEWLEYTVNVATSGLYAVDISLASLGAGGTFHVEFGGVDQTGPLTVPDTGGWQNWQTLTKSNVTLTAGPQVMRLVMDSGGVSNLVGDIDYLDFSFVGDISSNSPPVAGFTANPTNGTAPLLVDFTDSSSGAITSRLWDFGDGNTSGVVNPSHTYNNPGVYGVTLTVFGPGGSNTLSQPGLIVVTLPPPPTAGFTANPTNGAAPLFVNFADASSGTITNRLWDFGDGNTIGPTNPSHTYNNPGAYAVALTVFGPGGTNTLSQPGLIVVTPAVVPPPPAAGFTATPTEGAVPLLVNFTDTSTGIITNRAWDFGDGTTAGSANVAHTYNAPGVYSATLSVFGPGGSNTATQANLITVTNTPPQILSISVASSFLETIGGTYVVKSGNVVAFATGTSDADGNALSCVWDFGDGGTSTDCNPSHVFTSCGPHDVTVTVSDGFASVSTGLTIAATCPLTINSLKLQSKFKQVGADTCSIAATLPASANDFSPANAAVTLNIGGVPVTFQLDAKGRGSNQHGSVKFAYNKKTAAWTLTGKLRGDMHDAWAQIGLTNDILINSAIGVPVQLTIESNIVGVFDADPSASYTDKAGTSGTATYVAVK
ncbi:MAG TPA: PKD domain-containing protein [Verrucomicrobiae bacterium]|nr:PKD domain-containing protein [Verrucomicrobiae bacterium]